jgi:hypothetical protein
MRRTRRDGQSVIAELDTPEGIRDWNVLFVEKFAMEKMVVLWLFLIGF